MRLWHFLHLASYWFAKIIVKPDLICTKYTYSPSIYLNKVTYSEGKMLLNISFKICGWISVTAAHSLRQYQGDIIKGNDY